LSFGGSSPYTSTDRTNRNKYIYLYKYTDILVHKRNNTKTQYKQYKNTVNTSTHITKTPTQYKTS
jgi:hypothetical protein